MTVHDPERIYRKAGRFVLRRVGAKVFIVSADSTLHILDNATAVAMWDLLEAAGDTGGSARLLAPAIARRFEVDEATAERDAAAFLADLERLGVLVAGAAGRIDSM